MLFRRGSVRVRNVIGEQDVMSEEQKDAALTEWLGPTGSPIIVVTSALGISLDYTYVRWVIHVGAPRRMTDFSQESGRGGRDGRVAESIILLRSSWQPYTNGGQYPKDEDEEFMQMYLTQQHCLRAVMSQYLDTRPNYRWCMMGEDDLCRVCPRHHTERRPASLELTLARPLEHAEFTPDRRHDHHEDEGVNDHTVPGGRDDGLYRARSRP
jgi:superfamily II DNA helicase RecQ